MRADAGASEEPRVNLLQPPTFTGITGNSRNHARQGEGNTQPRRKFREGFASSRARGSAKLCGWKEMPPPVFCPAHSPRPPGAQGEAQTHSRPPSSPPRQARPLRLFAAPFPFRLGFRLYSCALNCAAPSCSRMWRFHVGASSTPRGETPLLLTRSDLLFFHFLSFPFLRSVPSRRTQFGALLLPLPPTRPAHTQQERLLRKQVPHSNTRQHRGAHAEAANGLGWG